MGMAITHSNKDQKLLQFKTKKTFYNASTSGGQFKLKQKNTAEIHFVIFVNASRLILFDIYIYNFVIKFVNDRCWTKLVAETD